jgi:hypothetical protein
VRPRLTILGMMALIAILALELGILPAPITILAIVFTGLLSLLALHPEGRPVVRVIGLIAAALIGCGLLMWLLAYLLMVAKWDGTHSKTLTFLVRDERTRRPIPGAEVSLVGEYLAPRATATGSDGQVALTGEFRASGSRGALVDDGVIFYRGNWARATAPGYQTAWVPLAVPLDRYRDLYETELPTIPIDLLPAETTASGPLAEFAGGYFRGDPRGRCSSLWLTSDGRYALTTRDEAGHQERSRGTALRSGRALVLDQALWPVRWGGRLYLLEAEQVAPFEKSMRTRDEPRTQPFGPFLLREGDWEKKADGSPGLPTGQGEWEVGPAPNPPEATERTP